MKNSTDSSIIKIWNMMVYGMTIPLDKLVSIFEPGWNWFVNKTSRYLKVIVYSLIALNLVVYAYRIL